MKTGVAIEYACLWQQKLTQVLILPIVTEQQAL